MTKTILNERLKMENGYNWVDTTCNGQVQTRGMGAHHLNNGEQASLIVVQLVHALQKRTHEVVVE